MSDETTPTKRKYVRRAAMALTPEERLQMAAAEAADMTVPDAHPVTISEPARIIEVRCAIPPDLPGLGGTTTINVTDPTSRHKGLALSLHRIGILAEYADGSFFGVIPYAQVKRIRFDRRPD